MSQQLAPGAPAEFSDGRSSPSAANQLSPSVAESASAVSPLPEQREGSQSEVDSDGDGPLKQLDDVCTDWESDTHPLTLRLHYVVRPGRMGQFREWLQDMIVEQSQNFPGYNGTVVYVPPEGAVKTSKGTLCITEIRYRGASNLKHWLESPERSKLIQEGIAAGFWFPKTRTCDVQNGFVSTVDAMWQDAFADDGGDELGDGRKPEIAKWRLVMMTIISVYTGNLLLSWPINSAGDYFRSTLGYPLGSCLIQFINVLQVNWVITPFLRPYLKWFLVRKRPKFRVFYVEPLLTVYEGFPWFRKGKSIPCASWQCLGGRKKPEPPSGLNQTGDIEAGRAVKAATASQADTQAVESMVAAQAENILKAVDSQITLQASKLNQPLAKLDGQVSVVLRQNVIGDKFKEFEAAVKNLGAAASKFSPHEYVGTTLIRPSPGSTLYTIILRFATKKALERWLKSDERKSLLVEKNKYLISPAEAQVSTYSVLDMLVSDSRGSGGDGEKLPPAKFKSHLIIFTSLYTMTMFTSYAIWGESLDELPFPVRLLCQILVNTTTIGYTFVPFLSALLQRWLDMPRPRCFKNPRIRNFFLLRWLYEGFNDQELLYIMGVGTGLLIGFGAGGRIELRP